jgi:hypothetical protein
MKEFFNFRDKEFREYFITFAYSSTLDQDLSFLNKDEITNNDLIRFYLEYSEEIKCYSYRFYSTLFNYKMMKIGEDRLFKFFEIVKEKTNFTITSKLTYDSFCYRIRIEADYDGVGELIDMFLDEA